MERSEEREEEMSERAGLTSDVEHFSGFSRKTLEN
jgi:hypothetical protein